MRAASSFNATEFQLQPYHILSPIDALNPARGWGWRRTVFRDWDGNSEVEGGLLAGLNHGPCPCKELNDSRAWTLVEVSWNCAVTAASI